MAAKPNFRGVGASNVGFVLSFVDEATPSIFRVTNAYEALTRAMDFAQRRAKNTIPFERGMNKIASALKDVVEQGVGALGVLGSLAAVVRGGVGKVSINVTHRVPRLAAGGIATGPTTALIGEAGPEAIIPLDRLRDLVGKGIGMAMDVKDSTIKATSKMFSKFKEVAKPWGESFGKNAPKIWKALEGTLKGLAALEFAEKFKEGVGGVQQSKAVQDTTQSIESFNENMWKAQAYLNLSREEFRGLRKEMLGYADSSKAITRTEVGESLDALTSAGVRSREELNMLIPIVLDTSKAFKIDYASAAETAYKATTMFGLSGEQAAAVMATMGKMSEQTAISYDELSKKTMDTTDQFHFFLKNAGPEATESFMKATAAAHATMADNWAELGDIQSFIIGGLQDEIGGPARIALRTLTGLSQQSFDAMVNSGNAAGIFEAALTGVEKQSNAGAGGLKILEDALGWNADMIMNLAPKIKGINESYSEMKNVNVDSANANQVLSERIATQTKLGDTFRAGISNTIGEMGIFGVTVNDVAGYMDELGFMEIYAQLMLFKQGLLPLLGIFNNLAIGLAAKFIPSLVATKIAEGGATVTTWAFNAALFANPITWIVLGIVALIAAIILLVKYWKPVTEAFKSAWGWVKNLAATIWEKLTPVINFLKEHWLLLLGPIGLIIEGVKYLIGLFSQAPAGDGFFGWVKNLAATIWEKLTPVINFLKEHWLLLLGPIGLIIEGVKYLIGLFSQAPAGDGFFGWVKKGIDLLMSPLGWLWDKLKGIWNMFFGGRGGAIEPASMVGGAGGIRKETDVGTPSPKAKAMVTTETGKKMEIEIDNSDVVDILDKISMILVDIRDGKRRGARAEYTVEDVNME